ncbi:hypothetical protein [Streptomyces sp. NPDC051554]|uniref:hypothetical protein n=1 Tax=Streptomyces sp. NPDC051554 TaxID=3365656 RepID=UPI003796B9F1
MSRRPPLSVRMTPGLAEDLAVLQRGGMSASDAVRHAVHLVADGQREAERLAAGTGRRPWALTLPVRALFGRPAVYDGADQGV